MSLSVGNRASSYIVIGLIAAAVLLIWLPVPYVVRLPGAVLLAFFLPGWAFIHAVWPEMQDVLERLVLAVALSYAATVLVSLIVLYLLGQVAVVPVVGVLGLGSLALAVVGMGRARTEGAWGIRLNGRDLVYVGLCAAVAAFFTLANVGYADYWGDEMNGLLRAISVIAGRADSIFEHTKGPVEIMIPAVFGLLARRFDPFTVRLPFALAHVVGMGAFYLLVRRMFGARVGLLAALTLAVNGMFLAFGRMVQYQTVVFLMTGSALLTAYHFYQYGKGKYLCVGAFLVGVGLLAHYDMLLVLPPVCYLVRRRHGEHWAAWRSTGRWLAVATALLTAIVALFYLPFALHPHLGQTFSYLGRVVGMSNWPVNNFDELYVYSVLHNSVYYILLIWLLGVGKVVSDLVLLFRRQRLNRASWIAVCAILAAAVVCAATGRLAWMPPLVGILLLVVLVGVASIGPELKLMYIWTITSFIAYVFFVDHPRMHLQMMYPGWSVLAALLLAGLLTRVRGDNASSAKRLLDWRRIAPTAAAVATLGLLYLLFAGYQYMLFVDTQTEYILTYPKHKSQLYLEDPRFPFGSRRLYGAPHRLGWQMINQLFLSGEFRGDWASNDEGTNLFWYTLGAPQSPCYPRYYFASQFEQRDADDSITQPAFALDRYVRIGQVWNRDRSEIDVYEFAPLGGQGEATTWQEPGQYDSYVTPDDFKTDPYEDPLPSISEPLASAAVFRPGPVALQRIAEHYADARIEGVRDKVALLGYDLEDRWARPGGVVVVTLYWQALEVVNLPYKVFVHLGSADGSREWAQADDWPACGTQPTQRWQVGQIVADRHVVQLPPDVPTGEQVLLVGLYEPQTTQRLDLLDTMGNPQGTEVTLAPLRIRAAE
jgi:hypothetical protein